MANNAPLFKVVLFSKDGDYLISLRDFNDVVEATAFACQIFMATAKAISIKVIDSDNVTLVFLQRI